MLSEGWATPLAGFMSEKEYLDCLHFSRLRIAADSSGEPGANGSGDGGGSGPTVELNQSVPIVLAVSEADKARLEKLNAFVLTYKGTYLQGSD